MPRGLDLAFMTLLFKGKRAGGVTFPALSFERKVVMTSAIDTVRAFYAALAQG